MNLEPWNRLRAQQRAVLLPTRYIPESQSCISPATTVGLSGHGMALVPQALHFAPKIFNFISQRVTKGQLRAGKTISSFSLHWAIQDPPSLAAEE